MLEVAGLSGEQEAVYRFLVTAGGATEGDVARLTGTSAADSTRVLHSLVREGLADHSDDTPRVFRAVPPDVALLPRIRRTAEALDAARATADQLLEAHRDTARRHDASRLLEVVTGAEALRRRLRQIQSEAREEMLWFCRAHYVAMPSGTNAEEYEALARGVRYRVLYEQAFFAEEGALDNVAAGVRAGESARVVHWLPLRLAVADRSVGIFPLVPGGPHGGPDRPTTAVVRDRSLLNALIALFESYWEHAVPLHLSESGGLTAPGTAERAVLSPTDDKLLSLLVAGVTDKAIASQMGLSRRTVQRRVHALMRRAGVGTRMQLAWQAARRGWL